MQRSLLIAAALCLIGCGGSGAGGGAGGGTITNLGRLVLATGLDSPMQYIASTGNSHLAYVLERSGRVRVLQDDALLATPALDISGNVATDGECGLLGMALAPDFVTSRQFYLHFNTNEGGTLRSRVSRYTMAVDGLTASPSGTPILRVDQPYSNHKGGSIHFRDGHLYIGFGDGGSGNDPENRAQDPQSLLGKVLRISVTGDDFPADPDNNYSVPADNPFVGVSGVRGEIWAFGLRNPFRWSFDSQTGAMTIGDVGQDGYEEVDYEPDGAGGRNYGWRQWEGRHLTGNGGFQYPVTPTEPYLEYDHGVGEAVIGGFVVRSSGLGLTGRCLVGDYVTNRLWSAPVGPGAASMSSTLEIVVTGGWDGIVSIDPDASGQPVIVETNRGEVSRLVSAP